MESKGYRIYWPQKQSITVKHNVIFNESDITTHNNILITAGDVVDKGERDKVLQPPASNANAANVPSSAPAPQPKAPDVTPEPALEPEPQNLVPFPSGQEPAEELLLNHSKRKTLNQNWVKADTFKRNHLACTSEWPRAYPHLMQTLQIFKPTYLRIKRTGKQSYPLTSH